MKDIQLVLIDEWITQRALELSKLNPERLYSEVVKQAIREKKEGDERIAAFHAMKLK